MTSNAEALDHPPANPNTVVPSDSSSCDTGQRPSTEPSQQFTCLFTKHKTQKHKVWHDGRLVLRAGRATLYNANPLAGSGDPVLDECEITSSQQQAINERYEASLETETYTIQVEGPWENQSLQSSQQRLQRQQQQSHTRSSSLSMQKLMNRKFQKPNAYVPPPPNAQPHRLHKILGKRRRPLQPGELQRIHYGNGLQSSQQHPASVPREQFQDDFSTHNAPSHSTPPSYQQYPPQPRASTASLRPQQGQTAMTTPYDDNTPDTFSLGQQREQTAEQPSYSFTDGIASTTNRSDHELPHTSLSSANNNNRSGFISNEFNASRYYGLDEEEEEEEDGEVADDPEHNNHSFDFPFGKGVAQSCSQPYVNGHIIGNQWDPSASISLMGPFESSTSQLPQKHQMAGTNRSAQKGRSSQELMDLFGAANVETVCIEKRR